MDPAANVFILSKFISVLDKLFFREDDPRPNLWQKPESNWAKIEFNGLNMHHTNEKNWARGADMHLQGCQFSDNTRGWVHKGTAPTPGATKSVTDSIFVGYTKNTGHKLCTHDSNLDYDSRDLVTPRICSDTREGIVDLINERPQTDVLVRRIIYWYKVGVNFMVLSSAWKLLCKLTD